MPTLKPLPDCEGPKLECFTDDLLDHDFKFLDIAGAGCHGVTVKAEIDGNLRAIKIFYTEGTAEPCAHLCPLQEDPYEDGEALNPKERYGWSDSLIETLVLYTSSFNSECRVFGRLKEVGREDLAVRVHGYMLVYLNEQVEEQFKIALDNSPTIPSTSGAELFEHLDPKEPLMAIVKDWVPGGHPAHDEKDEKDGKWLRPTKFPKMLRDLKELHKCGIVVRDLKYQQYINGTLVDFSHAWTIPHIWGPEQGLQPSWAFASMAAWDLFCFQREVIGEWNWWADFPRSRRKHCRLVAYRDINGRSIQEFGQTISRQGPFLPLLNYEGALVYMTQDPPYDPSLFDWRNVGKQGGKNTKGAVTRKRKATAQQPRKAKKIKTVNEPEKERSPKLTSKA
ncbi:uncharacterized protein NECHADRAFT_52380 [Fusarium vanettenii 77-13-4]|uniref:Protein kinase domain-containing protein n=1 Tax=Fusarium vanettenii (strain ATCC MYA-4622 / CBS 123669 / FGSC 9596 / NRRL 45880 / 77-13-4) TaxID=660122 RepID=C7ZK64_FUSV7|nr:uncharacterized protein NECHADRAFT_52380 [Fusarium vanettenii 77-13-4]EEU35619.1 hypothetical protein NECHADRAFT_52380 [Fusarium vanettenii 77-13-4]